MTPQSRATHLKDPPGLCRTFNGPIQSSRFYLKLSLPSDVTSISWNDFVPSFVIRLFVYLQLKNWINSSTVLFFLSFHYKTPSAENRFSYRLNGQHILCLLELDLITSIYSKYIHQLLNVLYKWLLGNKNKLRPEKLHPVLRHEYNVKNNCKNTEFSSEKICILPWHV